MEQALLSRCVLAHMAAAAARLASSQLHECCCRQYMAAAFCQCLQVAGVLFTLQGLHAVAFSRQSCDWHSIRRLQSALSRHQEVLPAGRIQRNVLFCQQGAFSERFAGKDL